MRDGYLMVIVGLVGLAQLMEPPRLVVQADLGSLAVVRSSPVYRGSLAEIGYWGDLRSISIHSNTVRALTGGGTSISGGVCVGPS